MLIKSILLVLPIQSYMDLQWNLTCPIICATHSISNKVTLWNVGTAEQLYCFNDLLFLYLITFLALIISLFVSSRCMHAWAEVCHLSQKSKNVCLHTSFLSRCMQHGLKNHQPRHLFKHWVNWQSQLPCLHAYWPYSNSVIFSNEYILLLSALCTYVQVKKMVSQMKQ